MRKIVLVAASVLLIIPGSIQSQTTEKKLNWGFNFGLSHSNLIAEKDGQKKLPFMDASNGYGFRLGVLMDYRFSDHLSLSPKFELAFNNSKVSLTRADASKLTYDIFATTLELATHFVYKTSGEKIRPYLMIGPSYKIPLIEEKCDCNNPPIKKSDLAIDFGLGLDKSFSRIHFLPELRYSWGLMNIGDKGSIGKMNFHSMALVLNFM